MVVKWIDILLLLHNATVIISTFLAGSAYGKHCYIITMVIEIKFEMGQQSF